jgi:predicted Rdx family selenoprotein
VACRRESLQGWHGFMQTMEIVSRAARPSTTPDASLAGELLNNLELKTAFMALSLSDRGYFEVSSNKKLTYSKRQASGHPKVGEIAGRVKKKIL